MRDKKVGFRVNPEERRILDKLAKLAGLNLAEYLRHKSIDEPVVALGEPVHED